MKKLVPMRFFLPFIALFILSSCSNSNYAKLEPVYAQQKYQEVPDYSNLQFWAAHPDKKDPSDSVPAPLKASYTPNDKVDVFL